MSAFEDKILKLLNIKADKDTELANAMDSDSKNIEECGKYVIHKVYESKRCGFDDDEVIAFAEEYYKTKDIGEITDHACHVVVNEALPAPEPPKSVMTSVKEEAERVRSEQEQKRKEKEERKKQSAQLSLYFDAL